MVLIFKYHSKLLNPLSADVVLLDLRIVVLKNQPKIPIYRIIHNCQIIHNWQKLPKSKFHTHKENHLATHINDRWAVQKTQILVSFGMHMYMSIGIFCGGGGGQLWKLEFPKLRKDEILENCGAGMIFLSLRHEYMEQGSHFIPAPEIASMHAISQNPIY